MLLLPLLLLLASLLLASLLLLLLASLLASLMLLPLASPSSFSVLHKAPTTLPNASLSSPSEMIATGEAPANEDCLKTTRQRQNTSAAAAVRWEGTRRTGQRAIFRRSCSLASFSK